MSGLWGHHLALTSLSSFIWGLLPAQPMGLGAPFHLSLEPSVPTFQVCRSSALSLPYLLVGLRFVLLEICLLDRPFGQKLQLVSCLCCWLFDGLRAHAVASSPSLSLVPSAFSPSQSAWAWSIACCVWCCRESQETSPRLCSQCWVPAGLLPTSGLWQFWGHTFLTGGQQAKQAGLCCSLTKLFYYKLNSSCGCCRGCRAASIVSSHTLHQDKISDG